MRFSALLCSASVFTSLLVSATSEAHIRLMSPAPRYLDQKDGPCGRRLNDVRGGTVTTFEPGATITVTWQETIGHPGHFRISFDADGQDDFVDPASYTDFYTNDSVLLDDIADQSGTQVYAIEVTLPDIECENCTLQVVQVMTDKPPYTVGGNDLYYQCADLILRRGGPSADAGSGADVGSPPDFGFPADVGPGPGDAAPNPRDAGVGADAGAPGVDLGVAADAGDEPSEDDSGCSATGGPVSGLTWFLLFALLISMSRVKRPN